jgi:pimeloyl-ACP methyl ester carboxylesterase
MASPRTDVSFMSGGDEVAAWEYGTPGNGCVVMAHGFSLTRHDGLEPYAEAFADAGLRAVVFDHRFLGDSGGQPRQRFRKRAQLEDWRNAIAYARRADERIVLWGYSFAGGHVATLAARDQRLAAAIMICPFVNGLPRVLGTPPSLSAWILPRSLADLAGADVKIAVTGPPGRRAAMNWPGEADGFARAVPPGSPWRNEISPGVFATVALHRPLAGAKRIQCPVWIGLGERDITVDRRSVERFAARAPTAELHRYPYDHFEPFIGDVPAQIAADQVDFLRRRGLVP